MLTAASDFFRISKLELAALLFLIVFFRKMTSEFKS